MMEQCSVVDFVTAVGGCGRGGPMMRTDHLRHVGAEGRSGPHVLCSLLLLAFFLLFLADVVCSVWKLGQ